MSNIMVDLETMGQSSKAAIVAIGACKFDPEKEGIDATFFEVVDLATSVQVGLEMDASTVLWWLGQGEPARKALLVEKPTAIWQALAEFTKFCSGVEYIWSHGSTFDCMILEQAYRLLKKPCPFEHKQMRDTRTVFGPPVLPEALIFTKEGIEHHALDDAVSQAKAVQVAIKKLREGVANGG